MVTYLLRLAIDDYSLTMKFNRETETNQLSEIIEIPICSKAFHIFQPKISYS